MKRKLLYGLLAVFIAAQFFQPSKNKGNASGRNDITQAITVPANVLTILQRSCYDCHSNNTVYPWYDHITPVNWWVEFHVDEGKAELNFTIFKTYDKRRQLNKLKEIGETVETDEMPLKSYLLMHGDAELSDEQKRAIIDWTKTATNQLLTSKKP